VAVEELLEALDVLAEIPVVDVEFRPQGRLEGMILADVGRADLGEKGQPGEVGQPTSTALQRLQRDGIDGRLAPDEDRSAQARQESEILAPDLIGEAEDVAVPRFDEAVAVAEGDAFVLGVEPGLAEERGEARVAAKRVLRDSSEPRRDERTCRVLSACFRSEARLLAS